MIEAELGLAGFQFLQVGAEVVVENEVECVFGVAVQVDQAGEATPCRASGALHQPVDRAFFVGLQVIFVEVCAEIFAEVFAEGCFDEGQIGVEGAGGEADAQELAAAGDDVVFKPLAIEHGDDAVAVGLEAEIASAFADFGDIVF